jgi:CheY-like chemotaxis protein
MKEVPNQQIKVLVIEDNKGIAEFIVHLLTEDGNTGESVAGVREVTGDILNGIGYSGEPNPINLKERDFDVALVDGDLCNGSMDGKEIVPYLIGRGIPCVGISNSIKGNISLGEAGCFYTAYKDELNSPLRNLRQLLEDEQERSKPDGN